MPIGSADHSRYANKTSRIFFIFIMLACWRRKIAAPIVLVQYKRHNKKRRSEETISPQRFTIGLILMYWPETEICFVQSAGLLYCTTIKISSAKVHANSQQLVLFMTQFCFRWTLPLTSHNYFHILKNCGILFQMLLYPTMVCVVLFLLNFPGRKVIQIFQILENYEWIPWFP